MPFGQFIFGKIIKIVANSGVTAAAAAPSMFRLGDRALCGNIL